MKGFLLQEARQYEELALDLEGFQEMAATIAEYRQIAAQRRRDAAFY